jgi:hypothetical protein
MQAKIRHVALFTEKYERMLTFYQTDSMKQITTRLADETGRQNANRGHISRRKQADAGVASLTCASHRPCESSSRIRAALILNFIAHATA